MPQLMRICELLRSSPLLRTGALHFARGGPGAALGRRGSHRGSVRAAPSAAAAGCWVTAAALQHWRPRAAAGAAGAAARAAWRRCNRGSGTHRTGDNARVKSATTFLHLEGNNSCLPPAVALHQRPGGDTFTALTHVNQAISQLGFSESMPCHSV